MQVFSQSSVLLPSPLKSLSPKTLSACHGDKSSFQLATAHATSKKSVSGDDLRRLE